MTASTTETTQQPQDAQQPQASQQSQAAQQAVQQDIEQNGTPAGLAGKRVVAALGGNALGDDPVTQQNRLDDAAGHLVHMIKENINLVITHGNGPQVGIIDEAFTVAQRDPKNQVPHMPLSDCNAMSQGYIGNQLSIALMNQLKKAGIAREVCDVPTHVLVDPADPLFNVYDKPIGAFMTEAEAKAYAKETGFKVGEDAGRGWRHMVTSPMPRDIVELSVIESAVGGGFVTIAAGGAGIPLIVKDGLYQPVDAILDKDLTSSILAAKLKADVLIMLTAVDCVYINFNKPDQKPIRTMTASEARAYCKQGQFAPGSMLPKVEACIKFVEAHPGGRALITSLGHAVEGLRGEMGTIVTPD